MINPHTPRKAPSDFGRRCFSLYIHQYIVYSNTGTKNTKTIQIMNSTISALLAVSLFALVICQLLMWNASVQRKYLYAKYRDLDHLPHDSAPKKLLVFWNRISFRSYILRFPLAIVFFILLIMGYFM